jgi:hypothetical protein
MAGRHKVLGIIGSSPASGNDVFNNGILRPQRLTLAPPDLIQAVGTSAALMLEENREEIGSLVT